MVQRKDLKRIGEYIWEIPKGFRPDMRVPARLFADEAILTQALTDRSLVQLVNTATLPGIVAPALAMPDIHQGYGFPIGGVAAMRFPHGVVSPGGVGYDICCLSGDAQVLHADGYTRSIEAEAESWRGATLRCQDFLAQREAVTDVVRYLKLRPNRRLYRVLTEAGDEIKATADHPFWTPAGMIELKRLQVGDRVALYPFRGVPYETPSDEVIVSEEDIRTLLLSLGKDERGNALGQILAQFHQRDLLPLRYDSPQLPSLLKVLGYVFGDGTVCFAGKQRKGVTSFYGKAEDLEAIRADIAKIGFTPSRIHSRRRQHQISTTYREYEFECEETSFKVVSSAFAVLLAALGAPIGDKAKQDFTLPSWLFAAPRWQKRLFLAAFFGAELSAPDTLGERSPSFRVPVISLNKRAPFVASGRAFLEGISRLLNEFGVETNTISERREQRDADGGVSYRLRLILSSRFESLVNLWSKVGFEYNVERRQMAHAAVQYLKHKAKIIALRRSAADEAITLRSKGVSPSGIYARLIGPHVNRRFLERSLYSERKTSVRIGNALPSFHSFREEATAGLGQSGMIWERIAVIEPLPYQPYVYDFTVSHPDHNFIANGFIISNCGVRLLASNLRREEVAPHLSALASALNHYVPSGVGRKGSVRLSMRELERLLEQGSRWAISRGYGRRVDLEHTEEQGCLDMADPSKVSQRAKERGKDQVGTLGAGNHFVEVNEIVEVYDAAAAEAFGLFPGQVVLQIHCGSRGFGHQVCTDYVRRLQGAVHKYGIKLPDRQLVCAPLDSPEGRDYLAAMACAANYAWANRQVLTHHVRRAFEAALAGHVRDWDLYQVYDVAHNIAKIEQHVVDGQGARGRAPLLCVHRKGATRAFGPGHPELPEDYRAVGQPVLVPGSMGTASYVLVGTAEAMALTFGSTCHGAGRMMSRGEAKRRVQGHKLRAELEARGIEVRAGSSSGLAEEAPVAYKDVNRVVEVVHAAGIARKVAKLVPLAVVKG